MTSSDRGKLLRIVSPVVPLAGCSDLSAGAAFIAFICAIGIVMVIYSFAVRWTRGDFKRPVWLESIYAITVASVAAMVLGRALGFGDANVLNRIGLGCFAAMCLAGALEALLGILGVEVDLNGKGKVPYAISGLIALLMAGGILVYLVNTR